MLAQILDADARERLARVKLVKPEKARGLERTILNLAEKGKIGKVSEKMLIEMLNTVQESGMGDCAVGTISYARKKSAFDESDSDADDKW